MMPPGGAAARGEQLAALAGISHELLTDPRVADDLAEAQAEGEWDERNLALMRRAHTRATALPVALVEATTRANSACEKIWREAKRDADFARVAPFLAEVLRLQRETAQALGGALGLAPYDALMDGYQPGILAADVEPIFAAYETWLRDALPRAEEIQARRPPPIPFTGTYAVAKQRMLCRAMAERIGLDFTHARLDESLHPFCGGNPADIRITTFYDEANPAKALLGVLHETGHAMYERGLPKDYARQPVGESAGMAVHESQSLIVEMQACRSDAFLRFLSGPLRDVLGAGRKVAEPANLARLWRRVGRGFIRVDADEMTYPAHVILRFRLERAMIAGELAVPDLPAAWNEGLRALLGVTPPDDTQGCLQDIHWHDGAFGYFPSYTLGAMAAAQMMAAIRIPFKGIDMEFEVGSLSAMRWWLSTHIHKRGALLGFRGLLTEATGKPLDPGDFTAHLTARYLTD
jgi:carboxypeptidase Taq